jgi:hypothetical protein
MVLVVILKQIEIAPMEVTRIVGHPALAAAAVAVVVIEGHLHQVEGLPWNQRVALL